MKSRPGRSARRQKQRQHDLAERSLVEAAEQVEPNPGPGEQGREPDQLRGAETGGGPSPIGFFGFSVPA
jgi:hypothetical protein